jgi:hypothetical protein
MSTVTKTGKAGTAAATNTGSLDTSNSALAEGGAGGLGGPAVAIRGHVLTLICSGASPTGCTPARTIRPICYSRAGAGVFSTLRPTISAAQGHLPFGPRSQISTRLAGDQARAAAAAAMAQHVRRLRWRARCIPASVARTNCRGPGTLDRPVRARI